MNKTLLNPCILIFLFFLFFYLLFFCGHLGGDAFQMYLVTESLVLDHDISILDGNRTFNLPELERGSNLNGIKGRGDKLYSKYGIGLPLVEMPLYGAGQLASQFFNKDLHDYVTMLFTSTINCFITALICVLIFLFSFKLYSNRKIAIFSSFLFGMGSFAMPQIKYGMSEPTLTLCFLAGIFFLFSFRTKPKRSYLFLSGIFLGYSILTKYYILILIGPVLIYQFFLSVHAQNRSLKNLILDHSCVILPILLSLIGLALYNCSRFDSIWITGYHKLTVDFSLSHIGLGIVGPLFSPGKSIFLYFPGTILFLLSLKIFLRKHFDLSLLFLSFMIVNLLFFSIVEEFHGDVAWGLRFQYIILPFLVIPIGALSPFWQNIRLRLISKTALILGFLANLPAMLINMADWQFFIGGIPNTKIVGIVPYGNIYYNPMHSPLLGAWLQLLSYFKKSLTGNSLSIPLNHQVFSLAGYDRLDIWFTTILGKADIGMGIKSLTLIAVGAIVAGLFLCSIRIIKLFKSSA